MWIFLQPLSGGMWITTTVFFVFTGFVVWLIERSINNEFQGSPWEQVGMIFWYSFSTLVFAYKEKLLSNLSKFVVIIWMFAVLVITSSYTATLASMLTVQRIQLSSREEKKLQMMEEKWFNNDETIFTNQDSRSNPSRLNLHSFRGLFLVTGMSSTSALLVCLYLKRPAITISNFKFRLNSTIGSVKLLLQCSKTSYHT
ncbi:hypothetical protein HRI_003529900 [Hibiscus trionum]|nr:hypothetical protein HRI_003529900 [Hibiscus trionum]